MLKEIANTVRKDATRVLEDARDTDDKDLKLMWMDDAKDINIVADFIEKDDIKAAYKHARHMDTAAREQINEEAWDILCRYGA